MSNMPSTRVVVEPNSSWSSIVTETPLMGEPSLSFTLPLKTAQRYACIVSVPTPVCTGFSPVYRNSVPEPMVVDTVVSSSGGSMMGTMESGTAKVDEALALFPSLSLTIAVIMCVLSNGFVTWKLAFVEIISNEFV